MMLPPAPESLASAKATLAELVRRANELNITTADPAQALALHSVALAAAASLSPENLSSLTAAVRTGRLPRPRKAP